MIQRIIVRIGRLALIAALVVGGISLAGCGGTIIGGDVTDDEDEGGGASSGGSKAPSKNYTEHKKVLTGLGVDLEWTPPVDSSGAPLPDSYNPLGMGSLKSKSTFNPKYEFYMEWRDWQEYDETNDGHRSVIFDNFSEAWPKDGYTYKALMGTNALDSEKTGKGSSTTWFTSPKKAIGGDFDGDGYEEALVAAAVYDSGKVVFRLIKNGGVQTETTSGAGMSAEVASVSYPGGSDALKKDVKAFNDMRGDHPDHENKVTMASEFEYYNVDIASGDIDGDGIAEAIVAVGGFVFIVDNIETGTATVDKISTYDMSNHQIVQVACADFNMDGYCDWVEVSGPSLKGDGSVKPMFSVYDGRTREALTMKQPIAAGANDHPFSWTPNIAVGDFNGDGSPDMAMCGREYGGNNYGLAVYKTELSTGGSIVFTAQQTGAGDNNWVNDGKIEYGDDNGLILLNSWSHILYARWELESAWVGEYGSDIPALACGDFDGDGIDEIFAVNGIYSLQAGGTVKCEWIQKNPNSSDMPGNNTLFDQVVAGDVTGDGKADVLYYDWEGRLIGLSYDAASSAYTYNNILSFAYYIQPGDGNHPVIALLNADADSYMIEYTSTDLVFTTPVVAAVIGSSPYYSELGYAMEKSALTTTYGSTEGAISGHVITAASSAVMKLHDGTEVDYSSLFSSLGLTSPSAFSFSTAVAITAPAGEDTVVFTSIPYYVYTYTLTSVPKDNKDGPNGKALTSGAAFTVFNPGKMSTYNVTAAFYNEHNGALTDITIPHTIGQPFTYTAKEAMTALKTTNDGKGIYDSPSPAIVTSRSDRSIKSRDITQMSADDIDLDWNFEVSVNSVNDSGVISPHSVTHTMDSTLFVEGHVWDIPADALTNDVYQWGLLLYPNSGTAPSFNYLTYWVNEES